MAVSIIKTDVPENISVTITKTSGSGTNPGMVGKRSGKIITATFSVEIPSGVTINAGSDIFYGIVSPEDMRPINEVSFVGYYGPRCIVGAFLPSGTIRVRNASSTAINGSGARSNMSAVYVTA